MSANVLLCVPPEFLSETMKHYWICKSKSSKSSSLCVLVGTNHHFFPKWKALLHGMKRKSCRHLPGHAFWIDGSEPDHPEIQESLLPSRAAGADHAMVRHGADHHAPWRHGADRHGADRHAPWRGPPWCAMVRHGADHAMVRSTVLGVQGARKRTAR